MSHRNEFSADYSVPTEIDALVESGLLRDESWHNDVCPRFESHETGRRIWVEHINPELREWTPCSRYAVFALNEYLDQDDGDPIYCGDDLNEALSAMGVTA